MKLLSTSARVPEMAGGTLGAVIRRTLLRMRGMQAGSDGQLLERFVVHQDQAAFEALVRRHGPMVLRVCRRVLGHAHDAEDAFQATFIVLARRAATITSAGTVAGWLCGVAYRTALNARRARGRRREIAAEVPEAACPGAPADSSGHDLRSALDDELERLPEKYRAPVVLCYLEGKTYSEAAEQLGWPLGTVASRLSGACDRLRGRLARRGIALSAGALAALLAEEAPAAVPFPLAAATCQAVVLVSTGETAAVRSLCGPAVDLAEVTLQATGPGTRRAAAAVLLLLALTGAGWLMWALDGKAPPTVTDGDYFSGAELLSARGELGGHLCLVHLGRFSARGEPLVWVQTENAGQQIQKMVTAHNGLQFRLTDRYTLEAVGQPATYTDLNRAIAHDARVEVKLVFDGPAEARPPTGRCTFRVLAGGQVLWAASDMPCSLVHKRHAPEPVPTVPARRPATP